MGLEDGRLDVRDQIDGPADLASGEPRREEAVASVLGDDLGNQRLIGIGSQIANRDVAVGQAIRRATTQAISKHQDPDPATLQKIIDDYDQAHHISDPVTGQDLTGSYVLPEFQQAGQGTNAALAVGHTANINGIKIKRVN